MIQSHLGVAKVSYFFEFHVITQKFSRDIADGFRLLQIINFMRCTCFCKE